MKEMGPLQGKVGGNGLGSGLMAQPMGRRGLWAGRLALLCLEAPQDQECSLGPKPTLVETPGCPSRLQIRTSRARWKDGPVMFVVTCGNLDVKDLRLWEVTTYRVTSSFRMGRTEAESS